MSRTRDEIHASVKQALTYSDESWYLHLLRQDVSGCPLESGEAANVLRGALAAALDAARRMGLSYPALSPGELATALGLKVVTLGDEADYGALPLLGLYQPAGRKILLHEHALATIAAFIARYDLESLTPTKDLHACVLYHEIFHAIEDATPRIFTRSAMVERKLFGLIPWRRGLASASEIGAIHFSRLMAMTSYSPSIFGYYLLLAEDRIDLHDLPG